MRPFARRVGDTIDTLSNFESEPGPFPPRAHALLLVIGRQAGRASGCANAVPSSIGAVERRPERKK